MRRCLLVIAVTASVLAAGACASATMSVGSHVERGLNFGQYRTYDWAPADAVPAGSPRFEKNAFFEDHFEGAVERQLARKGFERVTSGTPDLLVHYHATLDPRLGRDPIDHAQVAYYDMGTLVVDIIDARTSRLVWRGWAQEPMNDVLGDRDRLAQTVSESVTRMMEGLPRRTP